MRAVDASLGVSLYRHHPNAVKSINAVEQQLPMLVVMDCRLGSFLSEDSSSQSETEVTLRKLLQTDITADRFERLEITFIKRLSIESNAFIVQSGESPSTVLAECAIALETLRMSAGQLLKVIRGESVGPSDSPMDVVSHKSVQCSLQQQKLELTENELHIARLAAIRTNWLEAALSQSPERDRSPTRAASRRTKGMKVSKAKISFQELDRCVQRAIAEHGLIVPSNFAPVQRAQLSPLSETTEVLYHFGRKIICIVPVGQNQLAVHIGGGYSTFEEYCLCNGPAESAMFQRKGADGDMIGIDRAEQMVNETPKVAAARAESSRSI
jgi:hypothetical protein